MIVRYGRGEHYCEEWSVFFIKDGCFTDSWRADLCWIWTKIIMQGRRTRRDMCVSTTRKYE